MVSIQPPDWIAHADWSTSSSKRWVCLAHKRQTGGYLILAPQKVINAPDLLSSLRRQAGLEAAILIGFDFPIGLPWNYARQIGSNRFLDVLPKLGGPDWPDFYLPASHAEQISIRRPFYPNKPGGTRQQQLVEALGVDHIDQLRRRCEVRSGRRRAAAPLFWTLGGQQVGKAAITGWQEVLTPARYQKPPAAMIWPFDGTLANLLSPGKIIIAETYPAEFYRHLDLYLGKAYGQQKYGKRSQQSRAENAGRLHRWASKLEVKFSDLLNLQVESGFGDSGAGEDPFDAFVGTCGLVNLILNGDQPVYEPTETFIREMEGWILGQCATEST